jgi:hypothetical protein
MNTSKRIIEINIEMLREFYLTGVEDTLANRYEFLTRMLDERKENKDASTENLKTIVALEVETARLYFEIHSSPKGS